MTILVFAMPREMSRTAQIVPSPGAINQFFVPLITEMPHRQKFTVHGWSLAAVLRL